MFCSPVRWRERRENESPPAVTCCPATDMRAARMAARVIDSTKRFKDILVIVFNKTRPRSQHVLCHPTNYIREENHKTMLAPFRQGDWRCNSRECGNAQPGVGPKRLQRWASRPRAKQPKASCHERRCRQAARTQRPGKRNVVRSARCENWNTHC